MFLHNLGDPGPFEIGDFICTINKKTKQIAKRIRRVHDLETDICYWADVHTGFPVEISYIDGGRPQFLSAQVTLWDSDKAKSFNLFLPSANRVVKKENEEPIAAFNAYSRDPTLSKPADVDWYA